MLTNKNLKTDTKFPLHKEHKDTDQISLCSQEQAPSITSYCLKCSRPTLRVNWCQCSCSRPQTPTLPSPPRLCWPAWWRTPPKPPTLSATATPSWSLPRMTKWSTKRPSSKPGSWHWKSPGHRCWTVLARSTAGATRLQPKARTPPMTSPSHLPVSTSFKLMCCWRMFVSFFSWKYLIVIAVTGK